MKFDIEIVGINPEAFKKYQAALQSGALEPIVAASYIPIEDPCAPNILPLFKIMHLDRGTELWNVLTDGDKIWLLIDAYNDCDIAVICDPNDGAAEICEIEKLLIKRAIYEFAGSMA